jgi:hypothetical protein
MGSTSDFADAAVFLSGIGPAPALATLDSVIGTVPPESVLGFSLVTLRRDLADLDERLAEQVRGDAANDWDALWSCQGKPTLDGHTRRRSKSADEKEKRP